MRVFQIATVSLNTTPLDLDGNLALHIRALEDEETTDASIVVFPELSLSGYGCEDAFYRPVLWEKSLQSLERLLPYTKNRLVAVGLPYFLSPYLYNVCAVLCNCEKIAMIPKKNLANTGIHYEKRWFTEWTGGSLQSDSWRFGDILVIWDGLRISFEVCEDSWVLHKPSHLFLEYGTDLVISPGASHFAFHKDETRLQIFLESSRVQENIHVFANLIGNESGRVIFDGGNLIAANGKLYAKGKRLIPGDYQIATASLNLDEIRQTRSRNFRKSGDWNRFRSHFAFDEFPSDRCYFIHLPGTPFRSHLIPSEPLASIVRENLYDSFTSALILGLFDYLRKSGMKGYSLSLSGGADSATLAILVTAMEHEIPRYYGADYWIRNGYSLPLLHTIYQQTRNNSDSTREIARLIAKELGCTHHEIQIDDEVDSMTLKISRCLKRELTWEKDNIALQNIQARVRSPLVWLLANANQHLLLSTGNRSEASVGYTTMDGDSSGSLAPLTGVSKKFLLDWLHYISQGEDKRIPPLRALTFLLDSKPTAELKPLEERQEDEKDLMPYPILQKIEYWGIFRGLSREDVLERLAREEECYSRHELATFVERFFTLFRSSQWKRERLPPSFHLDEYGLDPKSSYRYPIFSGKL